MSLFVIEDALRSLQGRAWHEALGIREACRRRRLPARFYVAAGADAALAAELDAAAVLPADGDTGRDGFWGHIDGFVERGNRFASACRHLRRDGIKNDDELWLPSVTPAAAYGTGLWAREAGADFVPRIVLNVVFDDFLDRDGRYNDRASLYRTAAAQLAAAAGDRVLWTANSEAIRAVLATLIDADVRLFPMPMGYDTDDRNGSRGQSDGDRLRIAILGEHRAEKGARLAAQVVRAAPAGHDFFVQTGLARSSSRDELADLAVLPSVEVHRGGLDRREYLAALRSCDAVLLPYDRRSYARRTSGVFAEAVGFGKPVVVPAGTWMSERIARGEAVGIPFYEPTVDSVLGALRRVRVQRTALERRAAEVQSAWRRRHSADAYLDRLGETGARCRRAG